MPQDIEVWNKPAQLDRRTQKAVVARENRWALEDLDDKRQSLQIATRLERGAVLTGTLNFFLKSLGAEEDEMQMLSPHTAARMGHVLDRLAMNGSEAIGRYVLGGH